MAAFDELQTIVVLMMENAAVTSLVNRFLTD